MPPEKPEKWNKTFDATKSSKYCVQPQAPNAWISNDMSEDCLYINVYTPKLSGNEKLPVMFWIYGGLFLIGDSKITSCGPDYLVDENVVVVTFNYRLGIFGFLSTEDENMPGNYGIKDAILALKWVHNNIEKFNGDPNKVTVFGQSAGAAISSIILQLPESKDLLSGVIMESGSSLNLWARGRKSSSIAYHLGKYLKIPYNNSLELVQALRKVPASKLFFHALTIDALATIIYTNPVNGFYLGPVIEPLHDGAVITKKTHEELRRGKFNHVPVLLGFNTGEANSFEKMVDIAQFYIKKYNDDHTKLVPIDINVNSTMDEFLAGALIKNQYFGSSAIGTSKNNITKFITDSEFVRPICEFARLISNYTATYFYRFSYEGDVPPFDRVIPGVQHDEELYYIWNSAYEKKYGPLNPSDALTRKRLIKLWTNFAKFGNPTPEKDSILSDVTWEKVETNKFNFMDIGEEIKMLVEPNEKNNRFWRSLYNVYGNPPFDTY